MPSSSVKAAETTSYDAVRATPFTRIHGRPTRQDYELLKKQVKLFETHQFCIQKLLLASKKIEIKEFVTIYNLGINTTLSRKLLHFQPDVKIAQTIEFSAGQRSTMEQVY